MGATGLLLISIATAINIIVIKWKIEHERYSDALLDAFVLFLLGFVFMGTITGLMVATISSAIVSGYLLIFPPKEFFKFDKKKSGKIYRKY